MPLTSFHCNTIAAAGTTQGTATAIGDDQVDVNGLGMSANGVILPSGCYRIVVRNTDSLTSLNVYPPSGEAIGSNPTNSADLLAGGTCKLYIRLPAGKWKSVTLN